ncbi:hypothetical protein L3Q82_022647, partial [Scortum barcoo]
NHDNPPAAMTMGTVQELVQDQQREALWRTEVLDLLKQLVQVQNEIAKGQVQVVQLLSVLGTQGSQQIQDLQNVARHQNPPGPLSVRLNSEFLSNQTKVVLTAGSSFRLSCHGNGSVRWSSNSLRLLYQENLQDLLEVKMSDPRYTGTYHCGYTNQSLEHLHIWVHLYIKDPDDPSSVFVTPRTIPDVKEGQNFLFRCLLTDPSITNLTLQSEDSMKHRGLGLPQGMNVTFDPQKGALIQNLQTSFTGRYVCSGWRGGRQFRSKPVDLLVAPRLRHPPSVSVSQDEVICLKGEKCEVTCLTSNPSHFYNLTWTHLNTKTLNVSVRHYYGNNRLYINSTLTVSVVSQIHSGTYTCTAVNEAGVATATTQLRVVDSPYLKIYLRLTQHANTNSTEVNGDLVTNISDSSLEVNVSNDGMDVNRASSSYIRGSSIVEVYEGQPVTLTFVTEAYPPIREQHWTTPTHVNHSNTVYQESYAVHGYRLEASLGLGRVHQEDRGQFSFHFSNSFFSGSQNIDLRIYRSPSAVVTLEGDTLACNSSGYPLPIILWYTCPGVQNTCGNVSTHQVSQANVTSQEEGEEEVRKHLSLPLSPGDDVTVECVAYNHMGVSRHVFHSRGPQTLLTWPLIGALSAAAVLLWLLLVVFYKWRQKPKYEIRWKIIESTDGNNYTFVDLTQLPYNHKWEFPRDQLRLEPYTVEGGAAAVPGGDAASQDPLYGSPVEAAESILESMLSLRSLRRKKSRCLADFVIKPLGHLVVAGDQANDDGRVVSKFDDGVGELWVATQSCVNREYSRGLSTQPWGAPVFRVRVEDVVLPIRTAWGAVLGSGAFGKVVEATAYGLGTNNNITRVAVKMLKPSAHLEERDALMSELKILSHLGYHDNIVNLLGACTRGGPMLMITEYCSYGDLLNFLRAHSQDFMASILSVDEVEGEAFYKNMAAQHARLRSDSGISCCSEYQEMQPVLSPGQTHPGAQTDSLSVSDLMRFSYQVAQGLDFLSTRNCIHRDVAARNVLLTDRRVAKICDFGLARDIRNDDSYIVQGNARLPVKWMAPESIFQCVYTVQSDVWSYGVLLWEIFSLGKSPYPNVAVDTNFYKMIQDGRHMDQPDFAPAEMYELMTLCWSLEPTDRPTFKMIGQLINRLLPSTRDTSPHHSNQLTYRNISECREEEEKEEEEVSGGEALKRGEEERSQREHHDDDDDDEEGVPMMKNIYQLS